MAEIPSQDLNYTNIQWQPVVNTSNQYWYKVAMSSSGKFQTAISADGNLYTSNNYGQTFSPNSSAGNNSWLGIAISTEGMIQTACCIQVLDSGPLPVIYISTNYGQSWSQYQNLEFSNNLELNNSLIVSVAMNNSGSIQIFGTSNTGVWIMQYNGLNSPNTTLQQISSSSIPVSDGYYLSIAMSGNGKQMATISRSSSNINISSDGGSNWTISNLAPNCYSLAMSQDGNILLAACKSGVNYGSNNNGGGIYTSNNGGSSWTLTKAPMSYWQDVAMDSTGQYQVACANNVYVSSDYGTSWIKTNVGYSSWYGVSMSSNGQYITLLDNGGQIYTAKILSSEATSLNNKITSLNNEITSIKARLMALEQATPSSP